jgi:hypothetical protein
MMPISIGKGVVVASISDCTSLSKACSRINENLIVFFCRDVFGDAAVVGDRRWGGSWGIDAELSARSKVSFDERAGLFAR